MERKLVQLADSVWLWPCLKDPLLIEPSVGVITSGYQTVLVDAGNSPQNAEQIRAAVNRAKLPDISYIIYTHHHWDHVSGACAFQVPIYAHHKCSTILEGEAKKPWSAAYLEQLVAQNPKLKVSCEARDRAIREWNTFRIVVPDRIFSTRETLELDDIQIELVHVGGKHAKDSIIVKVPHAGVMFLGDCYYPPPLHLRGPRALHSKKLLRDIIDDAYDIYIEGHDDPINRLEYVNFLGRG